ncbi:mxl-2, partial [Pristionchus pacificus]
RMPRGRSNVPSSSTSHIKEDSSPGDAQSPNGSEESTTMDRKKATHLRCERQRREAINNGYNELKELLPPSMTALGCKTTNAAILFRAYDYMKQLESENDTADSDLGQLQAQVAALRMIAQQYETMTADAPLTSNASPQAKMLQVLLEDCFTTFAEDVDPTSYEAITRTLLQWTETLENDVQNTVSKMTAIPFKKPRR